MGEKVGQISGIPFVHLLSPCSNDLVLTTGASQGLQNILTMLIDLNGVVFVDEVTYMIGLKVFAHFTGLKIITVPMTANGVDVQQLRRLVSEHRFEPSADKMFWGMYYTIPVYHNPTGITFTDGTFVQC